MAVRPSQVSDWRLARWDTGQSRTILEIMKDKTAKIAALEREIEQLKRQWPAHSVSPTLLQRLEELEEALAEALAEVQNSSGHG